MKNLLKIAFVFLSIAICNVKAQESLAQENLRDLAIEQMAVGRYGEAIDLLNKFISANARFAGGYHLRGLAFEKRTQYQQSVLDLRRATRLSPDDVIYRKDLNRVMTVWHKLLRAKIEGHEREIAIDPTIAVNYLEIGKSYRWLEEWETAEIWYDEYLARDDDASPDEIIRYTEILAKTGSIKKGERILKIFVERYPTDWRLWSRYGYFLTWLAKYPLAKNAFENSLSFKPFFKEAQDGLDIVNREAYLTQNDPRAFEKVYPIDRYYAILRKRPTDHETRFKLVDDLIKANRYEEAYTQLQVLSMDFTDDPRFEEKWEYVVNYRDETYTKKIEEYLLTIETDPNDKVAIENVAQYYSYLEDYGAAFEILDQYFTNNPEANEPKLKYQFARIAAWDRDFDKALELTNELLDIYPNNLDYKLFKGQIVTWTDGDTDEAYELISSVLQKRPNDFSAILAMGLIKIDQKEFDEAQRYADKAKSIDPINDEVINLQSNIDFQRLRAEEERLYAIIEQGRERVLDENYAGALPFYERYLAVAEPNSLILKEYGDVNFRAKKYDTALEIYNSVLDEGYDYDVALQKAKVTYALGDSLKARSEFEKLVEEDSLSFEAQLYLGDTYAKLEEFGLAEEKYDSLLVWDLDSVQISMVELRKKWIPVTGLRALIETFPNYIGIGPSFSFYSDNLGFKYSNIGSRLDLGVTTFLTVGVSYFRSYIGSTDESRNFTTFKGHLTFRFLQNLTGGFGFGPVNSNGTQIQRESDVFLRFEDKEKYSLFGTIKSSDAAAMLYSADLVDIRLPATIYTLDGEYLDLKGFLFKGHYQFVSIQEDHVDYGDNKGNDFRLRVGREVFDGIKAGYEYFFSNYRYDSDYYYSPQNFESHSLWIDADFTEDEDYELFLGGKIGTIPANDLLVLEAHADAVIKIAEGLKLNAKISAGSTARDDQHYKYFSGQFSMYFSL